MNTDEKDEVEKTYEAEKDKLEEEYFKEFVDSKPKKLISTKLLKIDNFMQNAEQLYRIKPYFFDESELWWVWKQNHWEITDDVDMQRMLDSRLGFEGQTVTSGIKNNHTTAMKWVGRDHKPKTAKEHWIQFNNKAFTLTKQKEYKVTPDFFFTNPIPWDLGKDDATPTLDKLFTEWVGEKYVQDLYEVIAYCCYPAYPIQTLICLFGAGRNGKSSFLKILNKFIGTENVCSTELDLITGHGSSRFETSKLYRKLVCNMGETNFGMMEKSSILKKLTGGDMIGFEMKGKKPFDDYNYAKILIASNSLPTTDDTSEGFYRRWHIIDFPNQFKEGLDVVLTVPEQEFRNLARKCTKILPKLLKRGYFANQGTIEERMQKYTMASNPLPFFIDLVCSKDPNDYSTYSHFYTVYTTFLKNKKKRVVTKREFSKILVNEGYEVHKTTKLGITTTYIEGLKLKENFEDLYENTSNTSNTDIPTQKNIVYRRSADVGISGTSGISTHKTENILKVEDVWATFISYGKDKEMVELSEFISIYPPKFHPSIDIMFEQKKKDGDVIEPRNGFLKLVE